MTIQAAENFSFSMNYSTENISVIFFINLTLLI